MAVGQNQCYHVGVGAPPILVYFSGDWDVFLKVWDFDPWLHVHTTQPQNAGPMPSAQGVGGGFVSGSGNTTWVMK